MASQEQNAIPMSQFSQNNVFPTEQNISPTISAQPTIVAPQPLNPQTEAQPPVNILSNGQIPQETKPAGSQYTKIINQQTGVSPQNTNNIPPYFHSPNNIPADGNTVLNSRGKLSCSEASTRCKNFGTVAILDFSNTTDFQLNGDSSISQIYESLKKQNIKIISIDLSNSEVTPLFLKKWIMQFRQDNINVLWNISNNKSINDQAIGMFEDLSNVVGLNISNTSISDIGLQKILNTLNGSSNIQFINVYNTLITKNGLSNFINGFNMHVNNWKQINKGKEYPVFKGGVIYTMELESDSQNVNYPILQSVNDFKTDNSDLQIPKLTTDPSIIHQTQPLQNTVQNTQHQQLRNMDNMAVTNNMTTPINNNLPITTPQIITTPINNLPVLPSQITTTAPNQTDQQSSLVYY